MLELERLFEILIRFLEIAPGVMGHPDIVQCDDLTRLIADFAAKRQCLFEMLEHPGGVSQSPVDARDAVEGHGDHRAVPAFFVQLQRSPETFERLVLFARLGVRLADAGQCNGFSAAVAQASEYVERLAVILRYGLTSVTQRVVNAAEVMKRNCFEAAIADRAAEVEGSLKLLHRVVRSADRAVQQSEIAGRGGFASLIA